MKFEVGQEVWLRPLHIPRSKEPKPVKAEVIKVGRKYLHVKGGYYHYMFEHGEYSHDVQDTSPDYALHLTEQDVYDYWEIQELAHKYGEQIRRIGYNGYLKEATSLHEIVTELRKVGESINKIMGVTDGST